MSFISLQCFYLFDQLMPVKNNSTNQSLAVALLYCGLSISPAVSHFDPETNIYTTIIRLQ